MLEVAARAKINWTLDILGKRPDGYHFMDMLMTSVALEDTLFLQAGRGLSLAVIQESPEESREGAPSAAAPVPVDENNLVLRAARALQKATGCEKGAAMRLVKRIPVGAGMGGGSADAAAALKGLCTLWGLELSHEEMLAMGLALGADVPFMLTGGLHRVKGIGEELTPLPIRSALWLVVTQPCTGLSTPEIFRAFDGLSEEQIERPQTEAAQRALLSEDLPLLAKTMGNVMEQVSAQKRPEIAQAVTALEGLGAVRAMMTGSGSAVYGVFEGEEKARAAARRLHGQWKRTYVTHTVGEGVVIQRR